MKNRSGKCKISRQLQGTLPYLVLALPRPLAKSALAIGQSRNALKEDSKNIYTVNYLNNNNPISSSQLGMGAHIPHICTSSGVEQMEQIHSSICGHLIRDGNGHILTPHPCRAETRIVSSIVHKKPHEPNPPNSLPQNISHTPVSKLPKSGTRTTNNAAI